MTTSKNIYVGNRYIPKHGGTWDNTKNTAYESLTIVLWGGNSYTSKIGIPKGIDILNTMYWVKSADYSEQIAIFEDNIANYHTFMVEQLEIINEDFLKYKQETLSNFNYYKSTLNQQLNTNIVQTNLRATKESLELTNKKVLDNTNAIALKTDKITNETALNLKRDKLVKISLSEFDDDAKTAMTGVTPITYNAIPSNKSLVLEQFKFPVLSGKESINLLNKNAFTNGKYYNPSNGSLWDAENINAIELIGLMPNTSYTISNTSNIQSFVTYKTDKAFSKGYNGTTQPNETSFTFTTAFDEFYVGINVYDGFLDTTQLQLGVVALPYESFTNKINYNQIYNIETFGDNIMNKVQNNLLGEKSINEEQINFPVMIGEKSLNLFNENGNYTDKKYYAPTTGGIWDNDNLKAYDLIKLEPNTTYIIENYTSVNIQPFSLYKADKTFSRGFNGTSTSSDISYKFTTNSEELYIGVTAYKGYEKYLQLSKNIIFGLGYETFSPKLNINQIKELTSLFGDFLVVGKGYLKKINDALAISTDSVTKRVGILVLDGIYPESISTIGRYVDIFSLNKATTIIKLTKADYDNPCLYMGTDSTIKGFTIILSDEDRLSTDTYLQGYPIHSDTINIDQTKLSTPLIEDCDIYTYVNNACVGCGSGNNQKLTIRNSTLYKMVAGTGGALLWHTSVSNQNNQHLVLDNVKIRVVTGNGLRIIDSNLTDGAGGATNCSITVINTLVYSDSDGKNNQIQKTPPVGTGISGNIKLTGDSYGNNLVELNA